MKSLRRFAVIFIVLVLILLTGCGIIGEDKDTDVSMMVDADISEEDGLRATILYYKDDKGFVIPVMRKIPWKDGIGKSAINLLIDEPGLRDDLALVGLSPVLPAGTEVIGISIDDGLARVDFNENILSYNTEADERAIVQSLVYTLTEFEAVDKVQLLVDGKEMKKLPHGTKIRKPLERENINLSSDIQDEEIPVVAYYKSTTNGEDSFFVPVTKGVSALKADIKNVLISLVEGAPEDTGLYSELPEGAVLNDVYVKDGVAYIDFSEEIKNMPDNKIHQQSMVYELGFTLKEIEPSISQVRILSGGKEIELNPDVSLNLPIYSNIH